MNEPDRLLTAAEFVKWVGGGKKERWAKEQAARGRIPAVKLGNEWRFHIPTVLHQCKSK